MNSRKFSSQPCYNIASKTKKREQMKQIIKTTAEFIIEVVGAATRIIGNELIVLSFILAVFTRTWWLSAPAVVFCCVWVYNNVKQKIGTKGVTHSMVIKTLKDSGYNVQVSDGGEINIESDGRTYTILCFEDGNIQFARSYMVPSDQMQTLRMAAAQTMSEVYMAKVMLGNDKNSGNGIMMFSVETLCSSGKELKATFKQHMLALDKAEEFQRQHTEQLLAEQQDQQKKVERKRIGFV